MIANSRTAVVHLAPGDGLLVRLAHAMLFVPQRENTEELVAAFMEHRDHAELASRAVREHVIDRDFNAPSFVLVQWHSADVVVTVFGPSEAITTSRAAPLLSGASSMGLVEHRPDPNVDFGVRAGAVDLIDPSTELGAGSVFAGGFSLSLTAPASDEAALVGPVEIETQDPAPAATSAAPPSVPLVRPPVHHVPAPSDTDGAGPTGQGPADQDQLAVQNVATPSESFDDLPLQNVPAQTPAPQHPPVEQTSFGSASFESTPLQDLPAASTSFGTAPFDSPPARSGFQESTETEDEIDPALPSPSELSQGDQSEGVSTWFPGQSLADDPAPQSTSSEANSGRQRHLAQQSSHPGPAVEARVCGCGSASPPTDTNCRVCSGAIGHVTPTVIQRPCVAILELENGDVIDLDTNLSIGRNPRPQPGFDAVVVARPDLSRHHIDVVLDGWDILVTDRSSKNGVLIAPEGGTPEPIEPEKSWLVGMGSTIFLGTFPVKVCVPVDGVF